jgi:hypothetical protein
VRDESGVRRSGKLADGTGRSREASGKGLRAGRGRLSRRERPARTAGGDSGDRRPAPPGGGADRALARKLAGWDRGANWGAQAAAAEPVAEAPVLTERMFAGRGLLDEHGTRHLDKGATVLVRDELRRASRTRYA